MSNSPSGKIRKIGRYSHGHVLLKLDVVEAAIRKAIEKGDKGKHKIAAEFGVGSGTVARIKAEMAVVANS